MNTYSIWYPLFDMPIDIRLSREQLQCVQDVLAGRGEPVPGWGLYFAGEIEKVLVASLNEQEPVDIRSEESK